jgi:hypothetical protein
MAPARVVTGVGDPALARLAGFVVKDRARWSSCAASDDSFAAIQSRWPGRANDPEEPVAVFLANSRSALGPDLRRRLQSDWCPRQQPFARANRRPREALGQCTRRDGPEAISLCNWQKPKLSQVATTLAQGGRGTGLLVQARGQVPSEVVLVSGAIGAWTFGSTAWNTLPSPS